MLLLLCLLCAISAWSVDARRLVVRATSPPWINPSLGGKPGNPGAAIILGNKSLDAVHAFAMDAISRSIRVMRFDELTLPSGSGMLTIRPPRITEATLSKFHYALRSPHQIWSHLFNGRLAAEGEWSYKSPGDQPATKGGYRAMIGGTEMMTNSQIGRSGEAKPTIESLDCKTNFTQLRITINGQTDLTLVDSCNTSVCEKARTFYSDAICKVLIKFVQEAISGPLSTFPNRISMATDQEKIDYSLMGSDPRLTTCSIWTGLEGKVQWRGLTTVPFYPASLRLLDKRRMVTFGMTDYTFNTLLHQVHSQGYRFSAADLLPKSSTTQSHLSLEPTCAYKPLRRTKTTTSIRNPRRSDAAPSCLGALLGNVTNDQFGPGDSGDLVFKSEQKAPSIFVVSDRTAYFDGGNGYLDIHGPSGKDGSRKLLARASVQLVRGEFIPKWNGANITGSIKITRLILDKSIGQPSSRFMTPEWISKLTQFATPMLTDMLNSFLQNYAQFPLPLLKDFKCSYPDFAVSSRTMQIDCDIERK